jgi:phosphoglycolate phosphatase
MARLLVFDLDGTLVDSVRDLAAATNAALARTAPEAPAVPLEVVMSFVGEGARRLVERSLRYAGLDMPPEAVLPAFYECYAERLLDSTQLYPGIEEALESLHGCTLAVLTNKPGGFSRAILDGLGVLSRFARVWGFDDMPAGKPDPTGLLRLMSELDAERADTWMIGDSAVDVRTARAAGTRVAGVTWGLDPAGLRAAAPDHLIDEASALTTLARL